MKIIKPDSISGEIMDLITSAKEQLIIITPYYEITGWYKLINKIKISQEKGIQITWYSRNGVKQKNPDELWKLFKIRPLLINGLHAKIYMNEKNAVITSLNLCKVSDEKSTDIGHLTQNSDEFNDIYNFYETYIKDNVTANKNVRIEQEAIPEKQNKRISTFITESPAFNGINDHIANNYKFTNLKYIKDSSLTYKDFNKPNYKLEFVFYEKAVKTIIQIPDCELLKQDYIKRINSYWKKISLRNELEFLESKNCVKYFYKSNFIIKYWEKRQLDFFLEELDIVIEIVFPK